MHRKTFIRRHLVAGCHICHGENDPQWTSANAQAIAAKHHDKTGHSVWVVLEMIIRYGESK